MLYVCNPNRVRRTYLGGHRIDRLRGIKAEDAYFPEEWVASVVSAKNPGSTDPTEGLSVTREGEVLAHILERQPELLGEHSSLPILLKLLDASERLVIQAHPTAEYAQEHLNSRFGKAESWYVICADEDAHVYLGFREGVTKEAWEEAFHRQDSVQMLSMLHRIELKVGDVLYVDGGVPHAIGGGCLLAELQEPSDLMVVAERTTPSGRTIAEERIHCGLGAERMFDVFDYTGYSRQELEHKFIRHREAAPNSFVHIIDEDLTDKFRLTEYHVDGTMELTTCGEPGVAVVIEGVGTLTDRDGAVDVVSGDGLFLPADGGNIRATGNFRLLVATP